MARRPKIVVVFGPRSLVRHWSSAAADLLDSFAERAEVHLGPDLTPDERESQVDAALGGAEGLLLCGWGSQGVGFLSAERLAKAPRLRYIGSTCHYQQARFCDVDAALSRGIAMSETAPVMSPWVAEYELALGMAALRNLPQEHQIVGANGWVGWEDFPEQPETPDRLQGHRVGLASFGEIHRHLARMLAPFDTDWEAFDPYVPAKRIEAAGGRKATDLVAMAARSEVFFIAIPPTPETIEIINRDVIYALPREAVFVLVSRMAVVEQEPLLERLTAGELRAAIDVYSPEPPPPDSPLRTLPNVVHTPHRAGNTNGAHRGVFLGQCQDARRYFEGEPLQYPLRPELVAIFAESNAGSS
ncbi:MAG: hypothetical protein CL878_00920 [Dehalococcoidia bacterium]|nr:hypothetical protein [Dehalococcoidia bacterium]